MNHSNFCFDPENYVYVCVHILMSLAAVQLVCFCRTLLGGGGQLRRHSKAFTKFKGHWKQMTIWYHSKIPQEESRQFSLIWDEKLTGWNFTLGIRKISLQVEVIKEEEGKPKGRKWQLPIMKHILLNNSTVKKSAIT